MDPDSRPCPECELAMSLEHMGQFSTVYVCRGCGSMLTIPPPAPMVPDRPGAPSLRRRAHEITPRRTA
jgi:hypothetical protein